MGDEDMRYASVCDGIGAVHVAWQPLGWECMWTSEIDPFPSAVVEQRWGFENRGDMTKHKEWPTDEGSSIDLLVGGTPCQSFSVAGLRQGLKDPRGNLMLTYLAIAERLKPRWLVFENVPGLLSSHRGKDFGSLLGALGDLGYGWAYRVLDAQWFGVAQRRRRVFVVGCFGDATSASKVLFESESVQRNPAPSRTPRETIAACLGASPASSRSPNVGNGQVNVVAVQDTCGTLCADHHPGAYSGQDAYTGRLIAVAIRTAQTSANGHGIAEDVCHTIDQAQGQAVAFAQNSRDEVRLVGGDGSIVGALSAQPGMKRQSYVSQSMAVRRLTPRECERLQGFPDFYTAITYRKKPAADGPRYKSLGNSMAVPCMRWIGERIETVEEAFNKEKEILA